MAEDEQVSDLDKQPAARTARRWYEWRELIAFMGRSLEAVPGR